MKSLLKTVLLLSLTFACSYVLADNGIDFNNTGLHPSSNDQSLYFLGMIFGKVGNVLNGSGGQAMGLLFGEFNRAVLILGTIVFTYVYGKGILDTAAHGEFLGKQANSLWVPLRSIGGMALMIPKASSGYCVIQVFLMWVVIQGIGAADMMWNTAATAMIENGGSSKGASSIVSGSIATMMVPQVTKVFNNLVCGYTLQRYENGGNFKMTYQKNGNNDTYDFDYQPGPGMSGINCGNITWGNTCTAGDDSCLSAYNAQLPAIQNLITKLEPVAHDYVYDSFSKCQQYNTKNGKCDVPAFPTSIDTGSVQGLIGKNLYDRYGQINFAQQYASDYVDFVASRTTTPPHSNDGQATGHQEIDDGWMSAGSFIYKLAKGANVSGNVPTFTTNPASDSDTANYLPKAMPNPMDSANSYQNSLPANTPQTPSQSSGDNGKLTALFGVVTGEADAALAGTTAEVGVASAGLAVFTLGMIGIVSAFDGVISNIVNNTGGALSGALTAILYLQTFGYAILMIISITFIGMIIGIFAGALGKNVMNCMQPLGYATASVTSFVSIAIWAALAMLLTIGAFLAIYLPLLPFIYFLFGILGWLVAVLETMIAAPIVALGIIHPEGHDFWGKAEPAVMLTINVFLRPSLMLFGLIASMLLAYAFIQILTMGFAEALFNMQDGGATLWANPVEGICVIGLYTFLIVMGCTQCFKLINEIPNRVLQWLGFQGQLGMNSEEAVNQARQNFGQISGAQQAAFQKGEQTLRDKAHIEKKGGVNNSATISAGNGNLQTGGNAAPNFTGGTPAQRMLNSEE